MIEKYCESIYELESILKEIKSFKDLKKIVEIKEYENTVFFVVLFNFYKTDITYDNEEYKTISQKLDELLNKVVEVDFLKKCVRYKHHLIDYLNKYLNLDKTMLFKSEIYYSTIRDSIVIFHIFHNENVEFISMSVFNLIEKIKDEEEQDFFNELMNDCFDIDIFLE